MRITDGRSDALALIKRIKKEIAAVELSLAELEYLLYECDDRCEIQFFERGVNDKGRSEKGIATDKRDQ